MQKTVTASFLQECLRVVYALISLAAVEHQSVHMHGNNFLNGFTFRDNDPKPQRYVSVAFLRPPHTLVWFQVWRTYTLVLYCLE